MRQITHPMLGCSALLMIVILGLATAFPPAMLLLLAAPILWYPHKILRIAVITVVPLLVLLNVLAMPNGAIIEITWLNTVLHMVQIGSYTHLFVIVFCLTLVAGGLFAVSLQASRLELISAFIYAGSAIGVVLSGHLLISFVFWELMAIASTCIILCGQTKASGQAALRYVLVHVLGGTLFLIGISGLAATGQSLSVTALTVDNWATVLILMGVLINAAAPPLWSWVADSYSQASPSGAVFLSAFTTKTAVFVLIVLFPGAPWLIPVGLCMVVYGIVYALNSRDIRGILAYSIVSQVGYMVVAVGVGTPAALQAAALQAAAHILYKSILMMVAGCVIHVTSERDLRRLGGLWHTHKPLALCAMVAAYALCAGPFVLSFTTKNILMYAIPAYDYFLAWMVLMAASAAAPVYLGWRWIHLVFFGERRAVLQANVRYDLPVWVGLLLPVILLLDYSGLLLRSLGVVINTSYSLNSILHQLQMLVFASIVFFFFKAELLRFAQPIWDLDVLYRQIMPRIIQKIAGILPAFYQRLSPRIIVHNLLMYLKRVHAPQGALGGAYSIGQMVMWVTVILSACLLFFYI